MTEDESATDRFLSDLAIDPKESEATLRQLAKDHVEILERTVPSRDASAKYGEFLRSKSPEEYSNMIFHVRYTMELFAGLLGCIKYIEDNAIRKIVFDRAKSLHVRALLGASNNLHEDNSTVHRFTLTKQAEAARKKRAASPRAMALMAAIEAELGASPIRRPYKEAGAMVDAVNRRLAADGFAEVSVDAVWRQLKKRPALLKSAEKAAE